MSKVKCETPPAPGTCCCNCKWLKPARFVLRDVARSARPKGRRDRVWVCWAPELDYADVRTYEHSLCEMWEEIPEDTP